MSANAGEIRARLVLSNDEFKQKMNEAREDMKQTGFSAEQLNHDFGVVQKGSAVMGAAVLSAIGGSVKVAADFEQSMARVGAVSGATDEELARLESTAREYGESTLFSASEAAEGLTYLSMAGFDVEQQIDALPAVLNGAIAGNMELGQSADIVTNIMTGFSIEAEESGRAVDVLVKAANTANTDIPQMGEAMKYVGPIADSVGWSLEETSAAVGKLSDAGIQGGQAGTVLRASLLALANPTGQTADAMEELNIEVLDAEGNMKPMPELMGHISARMDGMTDAQKTQTAAQLVGSQAAAGFIELLEVGEDGLSSYVNELENSAGAAEEVADIQANTLNGAFEEFKSVLAEVGIQIGQEFLPEFTNIIRTATDVVSSFDKVNTGQVKSALVFGGTAAAIGLTISSIGKLVVALRGLMVSMGPAGWLITGLSVVGGLFAANKVTTEEASEVNLDHARSLDEQSTSLETQIGRFDELQEKNKLSNDELAEFVDLQSRISMETDSGKIEELQARYDELQEKSGMSNGEMSEFLQLNDDILQVVPGSNTVLTEQGNVLLDNTDAAKSYNEQLQRELELELEIQANEASSQLTENIEKRKDALEEINNLAEEYLEAQERTENRINDVAVAEAQLQAALQEGDEGRIIAAEQRLEKAEENLRVSENIEFSLAGQVLEQEEIINNIELEIIKGQEAYQELINYHLKQIDVNAEKGKELEALDKAIEKIRTQQEEVRKKHTEDGKVTAEGQKQIDKLEGQIAEINNARSSVQKLKRNQDTLTESIDDSVGKSQDLNYEMEKDIEKYLEVSGYQESDADTLNRKLSEPIEKSVSITERIKRFFTGDENRHQGGIVGQKDRGNMLPKMHTGGLPSRLLDTPAHNEIDVRLLKNEMVLTEGQQANLFRMIETSQPPNKDGSYDNQNDSLITILTEQNAILLDLLEKETDIYIDKYKVGNTLTPTLDNTLKDRQDRKNAAIGRR